MSNSVEIYEGNRCDLKLGDELPNDMRYYHYRVKNPNNRKNDEIIMRKLHKKIYSL